MSAAATASPTADTDPAAAGKAAVEYGIGLIGVMKGLARCVFGLGRVTKVAAAGQRREGADTGSGKRRIDIPGVIGLLRMALLMADALRTRLRTPAVAVATMRPPSAPGQPRYPGRPMPKDFDDPLFLIGWRRTSADSKFAFRDAIAHMSDREVVERICTDLMAASAILGDTEEAARVAIMAHRAAVLIFPDLDAATAQAAVEKAARDAAAADATTTPRRDGPAMARRDDPATALRADPATALRADPATANGHSAAAGEPRAHPLPREVGRGPP